MQLGISDYNNSTSGMEIKENKYHPSLGKFIVLMPICVHIQASEFIYTKTDEEERDGG